ncbi:MAG: FHA domain-containing protein [Myxococcota bacterium]
MAWLRVNDPRGRTRLEELQGDRTVVGRSASCEVRIDDPDVGLRHVSILRTERGFLIVNETDALPIWDGESKVNNHFMIDGVAYRVGSSTLTLVTEDELRPTQPSGSEAKAAPIASAATMMADETDRATGIDADESPALDRTLHGPPTPGRPVRSPPREADAPQGQRPAKQTQVQGSGTMVDRGVDSTRPVLAGPPAPSSTATLPGELETSQTEIPLPLDPPGGTVVAPRSPAPPPPPKPSPPPTRTAPPTPRPNPAGSVPTVPPTLPPGAIADPRGRTEPPDKPPVRFPPEPPPAPNTSTEAPPQASTEAPPQASTEAPPQASTEAPPQASTEAPPVRFPPEPPKPPKPPPPPSAGPPPPPSSDSWIWRKHDDSQSGSGPSVYSLGDGTPVVHASSESWAWKPGDAPAAKLDPEIDLPRAATPPPAPPPKPEPLAPIPDVAAAPPPPGATVPAPPAQPAAPAEPPATQVRVEPVLLRPPEQHEPPLPAVSKELTSGHSWMWALPQSIRDGSDFRRTSGRGRPLVVAGLLLMLAGSGLIAAAFVIGLTPAAIADAFGGRG